VTVTDGPARPDGTVIDKEALRRRYASERDKRLRADGNGQYQRLTGRFAQFAEDPHTPRAEREPKTDHVTVAVIGGGFAGLLTAARLTEAGIGDVRIVEKGGGFGGTWYWNRYPGAMCDTASFVYMPLLEETGHMPTEKYAHGPEIRQHCERIGRQYGLHANALFHTEVTDLEWDAAKARWIVTTSRGDRFTAQFVAMGTGPLHVAKLPGIPGIEEFRGHAFHTSRWDYAYTGGDADGAPMDNLTDKRVAVIGTGATAVQCVPHLAGACRELYVFQRTPSSVDARNNRPTDPEWFGQMATPGWQQRWLDNFASNQTRGDQDEDLVMDGWTDIARRVRAKLMSLPPSDLTFEKMMAALEDSDHEKMEEIRARCDAIVADTGTAEALKAWYRQLCKRPCFHDEYLQSYNEPGVHLVNTDGRGVERITPAGVVAGGREYEVDCIVYASGFEVGTEFHQRAGYDMAGRDGQRLSERWADGMRTLHGVHVHGFPNAFIVQPFQGANLISNVPHNLADAAKTIAQVIGHAVANGHAEVEVTAEAEDRWMELLLSAPPRPTVVGSTECTPGYYNNEGKGAAKGAFFSVGHPEGAMAFFEYIDKWRAAGTFEGLEYR
jgi:cyclohexanone monooxygenase